MNLAIFNHEILLLLLGVGVLLVDLWLPAERKRGLGYLAIGGVGLILVCLLVGWFSTPTARKTWRRARPGRWPVAARAWPCGWLSCSTVRETTWNPSDEASSTPANRPVRSSKTRRPSR